MYIQIISTSNENFNSIPFLERIGFDLLIARNTQNEVWINWNLVPEFQHFGYMTEEETKILLRTNQDIACRRAGQLPEKLVEYFNLKY